MKTLSLILTAVFLTSCITQAPSQATAQVTPKPEAPAVAAETAPAETAIPESD